MLTITDIRLTYEKSLKKMQTTSIKQKLLVPVPRTRNYCSFPSCMKGNTQYTALTSLKTEAIDWTYVFSDRRY